MLFGKLRLYANTLSHLKASQFVALLKQRFIPGTARIPYPESVVVSDGARIGAYIVPDTRVGNDAVFRFLGVERRFDEGRVDWASSDLPKLWRYNLHYFDYLHDMSRSAGSREALVDDWIKNNPQGAVDAWEPYTVSLRIVNWIKWFLDGEASRPVAGRWNASLYQQSAWLERNIEYHLLANHYLKNGKALFFAGIYFTGSDAERWRRAGIDILSSEVEEQLLSDGGHFERSPMYHCIVLEDLLDVINLADENPGSMDEQFYRLIRKRAQDATDYLVDITGPDGRIPLFNDSAYGVAPTPASLVEYASRVMQYTPRACEDGVTVSVRQQSGYFVIRDGAHMLIVDCGRLGPDYQPGHAHCDMLSYELWLHGERAIVDTGVFDYENSRQRMYSRSTRGHNTIMLNGCEQSEIWGVFRVARRAQPRTASCELSQGEAIFSGSHDGYARVGIGVVHSRTIRYKDARWEVADELVGDGSVFVENNIHLAPGLVVSGMVADRLDVTCGDSGHVVLSIELPVDLDYQSVEGEYYPGFGVCERNVVIRLSGHVDLPYRSVYSIITGGGGKVSSVNK